MMQNVSGQAKNHINNIFVHLTRDALAIILGGVDTEIVSLGC